MIRKDFLLEFKKQDKKLESDINSIEDDKYLLLANRPLKEKDVSRMPNSKLENFLDKILYDTNSNKVLFSTNYKKEMILLKKSQNILNALKFQGKNKPIFKPQNNITKNREKKEIIILAQTDVDNQKRVKNDEISRKNKENEDFYKDIIEEKQRALSPEQKYRQQRFNKIYNSIKNKIESIDLPEVKLNYENVYSRLYHNVVLTNAMINQQMVRKNSALNIEIRSHPSMKRNFSVKSVFESNIGKEFTVKITSDQIMKCLNKHSGGPLPRYEGKVYFTLNFYQKNDILSSLNTHNINSHHANNPSVINSTILVNGDSLIHDAVFNQKIELVVYLLEKGIEKNLKNNEGNTPLHIACLASDVNKCKKEVSLNVKFR